MQSQGLQLHQTLKQEQILAPVQLQSLEYLIAPVMELQSKIAEELETNPVLEQEQKDLEKKSDSQESLEISAPDTQLGKEEAEYTADEDFPNIEEMTERWNDYLPPLPSNSGISNDEEKYNHFFNSIIAPSTIEDQLLEQLSFSDKTDEFKELCKLIIGSINEVGYFQGDLKDLAVLGGVGAEEMAEALEYIQSFDPAGIGARNLKECLLLQLKRENRENSLAAKITEDYLDDLAANHLPQIAKSLNITLDELKEAIQEIRKLTPYPWVETGLKSNPKVIVPELAFEKIDDEYTVILKNEYIPQLRISEKYLNMLEDPNIPKDTKEYIKNKVLKGNLIIKNIQQRQETIRKIAEIIIDTQYDFLEEGVEYLKPLTMKEVADKIGVHETTVSRAVANKYILIDGKVVLIMSCNLNSQSLPPKGFERNFILVDDSKKNVDYLTKLFEADWQNAKDKANRTPASKPKSLLINPNDGYSVRRITQEIGKAEKTLNIYMMYFDDSAPREIIKAVNSAVKRGVKVKILCSSVQKRYIINKKFGKNRKGKFTFADNLQVIIQKEKSILPFIHAKVFIIDSEKVILGSLNMSYTSCYLNREVDIIINDKNIVERISKVFDEDWKNVEVNAE